MGHQAGDVPFAVRDASDVVHRAVGSAGVIVRTIGRRIAKNDLAILLEFRERRLVHGPVAIRMRDGNLEDLALSSGVGERRVGLLHANVDVAADEAQSAVAHHGPGKKARFAQDLEAIADAEHQPAAGREFLDRFHHRRKARDGTRAQVVAVGKTTGQDDSVTIRQIFRLVPDEFDALSEAVSDGVKGVVVAIGPGKNNDSKFHAAAAPLSRCERSYFSTPVFPTCSAVSRRLWISGDGLGEIHRVAQTQNDPRHHHLMALLTSSPPGRAGREGIPTGNDELRRNPGESYGKCSTALLHYGLTPRTPAKELRVLVDLVRRAA